MERKAAAEELNFVRLDEAVQKAGKNADWRHRYMNYEMELAHEKWKARKRRQKVISDRNDCSHGEKRNESVIHCRPDGDRRS